jgi:hypothetical protein
LHHSTAQLQLLLLSFILLIIIWASIMSPTQAKETGLLSQEVSPRLIGLELPPLTDSIPNRVVQLMPISNPSCLISNVKVCYPNSRQVIT